MFVCFMHISHTVGMCRYCYQLFSKGIREVFNCIFVRREFCLTGGLGYIQMPFERSLLKCSHTVLKCSPLDLTVLTSNLL